jgi:putative RNA 2'-phosphotransferase
MTTIDQGIKKLSKFLEYVLGRQPDEFGLIPDLKGFVKIKTLLQALNEDSEWRHIRQGHLKALVLTERTASIEIEDTMIRTRIRDQLPQPASPRQWPKLLYLTIRQRAYPTALEKGIKPSGAPYIILSNNQTMAQRLGHRIDNEPVMLTIRVAEAQAKGVHFQQYGELLFLADYIPLDCFNGPPLPKEKSESTAPKISLQRTSPGSFFPDFTLPDKPGSPPHARPKRKEIDWKKDRRQARREKARRGFG